MSRQRTHWDTRDRITLHQQKLLRKRERIAVLSALVEMHSQLENPDFSYLRELKVRLRSATAQFNAMNPPDETDFD